MTASEVKATTAALGQEGFFEAAKAFLARNAKAKAAVGRERLFGEGDDTVPIIADTDQETEAVAIDAARAWRRTLFDHGFGWIDGPAEYGGARLGRDEAAMFRRLEREFDVPDQGCFLVGLSIVAPAIAAHGTPKQKDLFLRGLFRGDLFACQLFSEPGNGSDLAGVATKAVRDGDEWVVTGQKVWNSYAQYADIGLLLARTDTSVAKHQGLTMFLIDMHQPGVEVRPLRQMTGGAHFNEVFLSDARVPDSWRLGGEGDGWRVAITTLMSEREAVGAGDEVPAEDLVRRLVDLWRSTPTASPADTGRRRADVAEVVVLARVLELTNRRLGSAPGGRPGPEMSVTKLLRNQFLARLVDAACAIAGPAAIADSGAWGRYAWGRARLSLPGLRIAGGTDEIQRNILSERVLGLPREPVVVAEAEKPKG